MKAGVEHRVPLCDAALQVLRAAEKHKGTTDLVFPTPKNRPFSDMVFTQLLRRLKFPYTMHGFRSTFRDWAAEQTNYPRDTCEAALAHKVESKVEAAYRRSDLVEKRRPLMTEWAAYLEQTVSGAQR
jgi:integrase